MLYFRNYLIGFGALAIIVIMLLVAACSSDGNNRPGSNNSAQILTPEVVTRDLAVGENSFSVGLLTSDQKLVNDAEVSARFFHLTDSGEEVMRGEGALNAVTLDLTSVHTHDDGTLHVHNDDRLSVYKALVTFDEAGIWSVELTATVDGETMGPATSYFDVREKSLSPSIGMPAPRSEQLILSDVGDIREIDTSIIPRIGMHDMTISSAVTSGRPTLIFFATPAFCSSRVCNSMKDTIDYLYDKYDDVVNFIHVEPYFLEQARSGVALCSTPIVNLRLAADSPNPSCPDLTLEDLPPADQTWSLVTEPWVFIVDNDGNIHSKFEGVASPLEIENGLTAVTEGG